MEEVNIQVKTMETYNLKKDGQELQMHQIFHHRILDLQTQCVEKLINQPEKEQRQMVPDHIISRVGDKTSFSSQYPRREAFIIIKDN